MTEEKNLSYIKQQRKQIKIIKLQQMKYLTAPREGNGNPLQYPCLENPRDGGAWWAAFYGVTQSRTWLKRLTAAGGFDIVGSILWVWSPGQEDPLEEGMVTHSYLPQRIPWTEEHGGL